MKQNMNSEEILLRKLLYTCVVALCVGLTGLSARADDNSGSKDNGKSQPPVHFIVGQVTKTPDPHDKGQGGQSKDGKQGDGGGGSGSNSSGQHH